MKTIKTFAICGLVSLGHLAVQANVYDRSAPAAAIEGTTIAMKGHNFNSHNTPLLVTATDEFSNTITLQSKASKGKLFITMPNVNQDTLMSIDISGGNRDENRAETFVVLVIDRPATAEVSSGVDDFGGDIENIDEGSDDDTTPPGLAKNIVDLPNLEFIGTAGKTTVFRSTIVGNIEGELRNGDASLGLTGSGKVKLNAQGDAVLNLPTSNGTLATMADIGNQYAGSKVLETDGTEITINHYSLNLNHSNSVQLTAVSSSNLLAKITNGTLGQKLTIVFIGNAVQVETNNASDANSINLATVSTIFVANDVLELFFNGINWLEISRTVNNIN